MISSNTRARKWFEEQTRQRTIEQMLTTLDQVIRLFDRFRFQTLF